MVAVSPFRTVAAIAGLHVRSLKLPTADEYACGASFQVLFKNLHLSSHRSKGAVDAVGGKYYVYGGGSGAAGIGTEYNDLWSLNLANARWDVVPIGGSPLAPPRLGCISGAAVVSGDQLYLYGAAICLRVIG